MMKPFLHLGAIALVAGPLCAADSPQDVVKSAAKALAAKPNYSWHTEVESAGGQGGGGRRGFGGPTDGKTEKDGVTFLSMPRGENTIEVVLKGDKGAMKGREGWQSLSEAGEGGDGQFNAGRFMARMMQSFKAPAAQAEDLASKCKELKPSDGTYAGDLTEAAVKQLLSFGPPRGGDDGPSVANPKGNVKFWVKDGQLTKYQFRVQGTVSFGGNDRDVDRTSTVEIKDVGTTKITVPEEAKKKLS